MKVGLIGNLAGNAYTWSSLLRRNGLRVELFVNPDELAWCGEKTIENLPPWIHVCEPNRLSSGSRLVREVFRFALPTRAGSELLRRLLSCDLVQSFTGSLFYSPQALYAFGLRRLVPYFACATGSDLREAAMEGSLNGMRMRWFFRGAAKTLLLNLDMIELRDRLGLAQAEFFPFPIDTDYFSPAAVERRYACPETLLCFMPSHLDWGLTDHRRHRRSTKGNDRFLRAFARYVREGRKAHAVILERGPDRALAHALVQELQLFPHVTFLPPMRREELRRHIRMADVVVDQFDVGAFGTIALEAMACGKPLMIYIKDACALRCYNEPPPLLNAKTEEDIFVQLCRVSDPVFRRRMGQRSRAWIKTHHDGDRLARQLIGLYEETLSDWPKGSCARGGDDSAQPRLSEKGDAVGSGLGVLGSGRLVPAAPSPEPSAPRRDDFWE